jgi:hypothetical protein
MWTECIWLRIGTSNWLLRTRQWTFWFHTRQGISWLVEWLSASEQGLSSVELVILYNKKSNVRFVPKSFPTGCLERELQVVQLSAIRCSCIAILWVSLASFTGITLFVASQRVFVVVFLFRYDSVRKLLDIPSYVFILVKYDILSTKYC